MTTKYKKKHVLEFVLAFVNVTYEPFRNFKNVFKGFYKIISHFVVVVVV